MKGYRTFPGHPSIHVTPWAVPHFTVYDWRHIRATVDAARVFVAAAAPGGPFSANAGDDSRAGRGPTIRAAVDAMRRVKA